MEARPCGGESDGQIVEGAWDFPAINHRYAKYLEVLEQRPGQPMRAVAEAKALRQWAGREREAWLHAVTRDPLLPAPLLPPDYAGRDAWRARVRPPGAIRVAIDIDPYSFL